MSKSEGQNKILSICIPSYNMEEYLNRSVDSIIVDEILDKLEIIIVNDGSKDRTLEIANDYKQKYPNSVIVIDKENGHYGSCVNAALKIATGKYFRILDADDWFDSDALITFVKTIENIDVDVVYSHFSEHYNQEIRINYLKDLTYLRELSLNEWIVPIECHRMHCLTYCTSFLHQINYSQTEGICYTDVQYVYFPLIVAKTVFCINVSLYQYYIGREDQSISTSSRIKNVTHFIPILNSIIHLESTRKYNINSKALKSYYVFELTEQILIHSLLHRNIETAEEQLLRKSILFLFDNAKELYLKLICNKIIKLWYKYPYLYKLLKCPLKYLYK